MNTAQKSQGVQDWLGNHPGNHPSDLSPHYNAQDEDVDIEVVECPRSFTPRAFKEALESCPVPLCDTVGDPATILHCLKKVHTKHFCFHCFDTMPFNSEHIAFHNTEKDHFSDPMRRLVHCPFANCPESRCFNEDFYFMSGLRSHIFRDHLPFLDRLIASTEDFGITDKPDDKPGTSYSSGYVSATTIEGHTDTNLISSDPTALTSEFSAATDAQENEELSRDEEKKRTKKPASIRKISAQELPHGGHHSSSLNHPVPVDTLEVTPGRPVGRPFQCNLCKEGFQYRLALRCHYLKQTCAFLNDKFCQHCEIAFDGFSIQSCILHLQHHQTQNS